MTKSTPSLGGGNPFEALRLAAAAKRSGTFSAPYLCLDSSTTASTAPITTITTANVKKTTWFTPTLLNTAVKEDEAAVLALGNSEQLTFYGAIGISCIAPETYSSLKLDKIKSPHSDSIGNSNGSAVEVNGFQMRSGEPFRDLFSFPEFGALILTPTAIAPVCYSLNPDGDPECEEGKGLTDPITIPSIFNTLIRQLASRNPQVLDKEQYTLLAIKPASKQPPSPQRLPSYTMKRIFYPSSPKYSLDSCGQGTGSLVETLSKLSEYMNIMNPVANVDGSLTHRLLQVPLSWRNALASITSTSLPSNQKELASEKHSLINPNPPIICVTGPKNAGKSTFCKYLINTLLSEPILPSSPNWDGRTVAYLETDVGQAEFTPGGMLSLSVIRNVITGPSFMHHAVPRDINVSPDVELDFAYFYGASSPKNDTESYISWITLLFERYVRVWKVYGVPLVINTHGWVAGLGLELINGILSICQPTHVIQLMHNTGVPLELCVPSIHASSVRGTFSSLNQTAESSVSPDEEGQAPFADVPEEVSGSASIVKSAPFVHLAAAHDLRFLGSLSYFGEPWTTSSTSAFVLRTPYAVHWADVVIQMVHGDIPYDQILVALNGTIVGLGVDTTLDYIPYQPTQSSPEFSSAGENAIPPPLRLLPPQFNQMNRATCQCIGLGLIRAVDPATHRFYITTPVPPSRLQQVNVLWKTGVGLDGTVPLPILLSSGSSTVQETSGGGSSCRRNRPYVSSFTLEGCGSGERNKKRTAHLLRRKNQSHS